MKKQYLTNMLDGFVMSYYLDTCGI
ncbi:uncharacterized protein METZ01_LOCUS241259 [marine metagenome]|uniref:Uncharacterized protein n=1 Tax=marine metagenome TaxID=408172 RepID=A0A382HMV1_9ZZZZ